jgi:hypothetical protein
MRSSSPITTLLREQQQPQAHTKPDEYLPARSPCDLDFALRLSNEIGVVRRAPALVDDGLVLALPALPPQSLDHWVLNVGDVHLPAHAQVELLSGGEGHGSEPPHEEGVGRKVPSGHRYFETIEVKLEPSPLALKGDDSPAFLGPLVLADQTDKLADFDRLCRALYRHRFRPHPCPDQFRG